MTSKDEAEIIAEIAVRKTFLMLGVDILNPDDVKNVQKDFRHLRAWRESAEAVQRRALLTAVGVVVTGAIGWLILALRGN